MAKLDVFAATDEEIEEELEKRIASKKISAANAALVRALFKIPADNEKFVSVNSSIKDSVKMSAHDVIMNAAALILNGGKL